MTSSDICCVHDIISPNIDWRMQVVRIIILLDYTLLHSINVYT